MHARDVIKTPGLRAVFYGRHSTGKQDIAMQLDAFRRFCEKYKCRFNEDEIEKYCDIGVSATKVPMRGRPGLMRLLEDINSGNIDVVVAYSESRLARDPVEHAQIRLAFEGVRILLCDSETVYNPENADLLSQVIRDGARTRDTFIANVKRGKRIGGRLPYGCMYDEERDLYYVEPKYVESIRTVYRLYARGNGFNAIAEQLGWYKPDGKTPYKERVKSIIINPFYAGYTSMYKVKRKSRLSVQSMDHWYYAECDKIIPVITYAEWLRCFRLYQAKQARQLSPRHYRTSFLLSGILYCSDCGAQLHGKNQEKKIINDKGQLIRTYGKRLYVCPKCHYSFGAVELHDDVLKAVITKILVRSNEDIERLKNAIKKRLTVQINLYEKDANRLSRQIQEQEQLVEIAKKRLETLIAGKQSEAALRVLEDYRYVLSVKTQELEELMKMINGRTTALKKLNDKDWSALIRSIAHDTLNETGLRNLLLDVLQRVWISRDRSVKIIAWVAGF
jgi:site-specific DNA recombinase